MRIGHFLAAGLVGFATATCGSDSPAQPEPTTGTLTVSGSSQPPPAPSPPANQAGAGPAGDPASWLVGLYSFHISLNSDCSGPFVTAFDNGGSALVTDFTTNPLLFTATGLPAATYPCVAMRISDILEFQSAMTVGACIAGVTNRGDIYRAGGEDEPFLDLNLAIIPATGTESAPSEDGVFIFFSTNPTSATARGLATNQVIALTSPLVIPTAITFYWDATNAVYDDDTRCIFEPATPALFR